MSTTARSITTRFRRTMVLLTGLWLAAAVHAGQATPDPRQPLRQGVQREALDAESRVLYDSVVNAVTPYARGLPAPLGVWLNSPAMAAHALPLYMYLRFGGDAGDAIHFPVRLVELAILVAAHEIRSQKQWSDHEATARQVGLEPAVIEIVRRDGALDSLGDQEAAIIRFGRELFRDRHVSSPTFERAQRLFGSAGVTDLAALLAFHEFLELTSYAAFDVLPTPPVGPAAPSQVPAPAATAAAEPAAAAVAGDPRVRLRQGVKREDLDAAGQRAYDLAVNAASAHPEGLPAPVGMPMWSPRFGEHVLAMYDYLRFGTQLDVRTKELAILMAARYDGSRIQWGTHGVNARRIGIEPRVIDIIASGAPADALADRDALVIRMGREMFGDKRVGPETFAQAVKLFGRKGVVDLAGIMAFYEFLYVSSNVAFDLEAGTNYAPPPPLPAAPAARTTPVRPADIDAGSGARLPRVRREDLDAQGRSVYDAIVRPDTAYAAGLPTPIGMWMHSPDMARVALPAFLYLRSATGLGARLTEVAILTTARETDCQYQWIQHERAALDAGVQPALLEAIRNRRTLDGFDERDVVVVRFGRELLRDRRMSAATFAQAEKLFGVRGVTDLAGLMGFYEFLYYSSNATFDIQLPAGQKPLLPLP